MTRTPRWRAWRVWEPDESIGQSDDVAWVVLADPDGNEFCILRALGSS